MFSSLKLLKKHLIKVLCIIVVICFTAGDITGLDVMQVLPSVQELMNCDLLEDVAQLPTFVLIMSAGYQQLDRVINNTIEDTTDDV